MERQREYDVVIIGGGITGPALAYVLAKYSDIGRIALLERREGLAQVASGHEGNAQSLHRGDIETNFTLDKALAVRDAADLVAGFLEKHPKDEIFVRAHKMVLAVGAQEVKTLKERYEKFKPHYPELQFLGREEIARVEPRVVGGRSPNARIAAIYSQDGYIVNYGRLAEAFVKEASTASQPADVYLGAEVREILRQDGRYIVRTNIGDFRGRAVVASAGGYSLVIAKSLGLARDLEVLPVAGSFYRAKIPRCLRGKVYTIQLPGIPFAAVHGDPEVKNTDETRFGPTAKMIPLLERHRYGSFFGFLRAVVWRPRGLLAYFSILRNRTLFKFAVKNLLLDLPVVGKWMFLRDARKIVPALRYRDLKFARGVGGIRPQIVDTRTMRIEFGEGRILGENFIANVTPSPGASKCLGAAERDAAQIAEWLGASFNRELFRKDHSLSK